MLIGEYQHNIDDKGRVFMPARFRDDLGDRFIVTKGLDNCLFVYSQHEWSLLDAKIRALPMSRSRGLQLFFYSSAVDVEPDKQGRILLPQNLREYAYLTKDVSVIGASTRVEIWDRQRWQAVCSSINAQTIAEAMDALGF